MFMVPRDVVKNTPCRSSSHIPNITLFQFCHCQQSISCISIVTPAAVRVAQNSRPTFIKTIYPQLGRRQLLVPAEQLLRRHQSGGRGELGANIVLSL